MNYDKIWRYPHNINPNWAYAPKPAQPKPTLGLPKLSRIFVITNGLRLSCPLVQNFQHLTLNILSRKEIHRNTTKQILIKFWVRIRMSRYNYRILQQPNSDIASFQSAQDWGYKCSVSACAHLVVMFNISFADRYLFHQIVNNFFKTLKLHLLESLLYIVSWPGLAAWWTPPQQVDHWLCRSPRHRQPPTASRSWNKEVRC